MGVHICRGFFSNFGGGKWGLYYEFEQMMKISKTSKMDLIFIFCSTRWLHQRLFGCAYLTSLFPQTALASVRPLLGKKEPA